jgi:hypothetical protein
MSELKLKNFFKSKVNRSNNKDDIDMQIIEWWANDELNESADLSSNSDSENDRCKHCSNSSDYCK